MNPEQREALRQDTIRWMNSSEFGDWIKEWHVNPLHLPVGLIASLFHIGGLWPWDVLSRSSQLGFNTPLLRRRYLQLATSATVAKGFIVRVQQEKQENQARYKLAQIMAGIGGTDEDDSLVESCLRMRKALHQKISSFPPANAGASSRPLAAGKSAYDSSEPGAIFVFNACLPDAATVPAEGLPCAMCIINPQHWPAILPLPYALAKPHLSKTDLIKESTYERPEWLEKAYPSWRAAMHNFLKERIKREHRKFYDSLNIAEQTNLVVSIGNPVIKSIELDAIISARSRNNEKLKQCLGKGVSPNLQGLLYNAVVVGNIPAVELLLSSGADIRKPLDDEGVTYLHEAVLHNQPAVAELLLRKGADPNQKIQNGATPLSYAYEHPGQREALVRLLEPVTKFDRPNYNLDQFLKIEDPEKAYFALCQAIRQGFRKRSPAELRVLSLAEFTGHCLTNGFTTFDDHARWAIVPCAEMIEAINEPDFAQELWQCIAIMRDYGKKVGCDPFDPKIDYVALDNETENKLKARTFDFTDYVAPETDRRLFRKTLDYVRQNRNLFAAQR